MYRDRMVLFSLNYASLFLKQIDVALKELGVKLSNLGSFTWGIMGRVG